MIYILAYILLGISTAVSIRYNGVNGVPVIAACFIWPLYWFAFVFAHFVGWMPAKCAWCGKSVAGHAHMDKWRAHYLDDCDKHPLAIKCKRIERYLDETDSKNTYNRVALETANATISLMHLAIKGILAEPYGCPMCDSGVLRNPEKRHWPDCPYEIARARLALVDGAK